MSNNQSTPNHSSKARKNRQRDIIWYNPPYSRNAETNIGRTFLKLIDDEFHKDHAVLHKIFNLNTVKISYSCMPNIKQSIDGPNKSTLHKATEGNTTKTCNCRNLSIAR